MPAVFDTKVWTWSWKTNFNYSE